MTADPTRLFVQLIKRACEKYLAEGTRGVIGYGFDLSIEGVELLPAIGASSPFEFRVQFVDEFNGDARCTKTLSMNEAIKLVGSMIADDYDFDKASNAIEWLRREAT